jgi:hypothetical protein
MSFSMNSLYDKYITHYGIYNPQFNSPLTREEFTIAVRIYLDAEPSSTVGAVIIFSHMFTKSFREGNLRDLYIKEQLQELINE